MAQPPVRGRGGQGNRQPLKPGTGLIAGAVLADDSGEPIPFAGVLLYAEGDSTLFKGSASNDKGRFFFRDVPFGKYRIVVQYLGYEDKEITDLVITEEEKRVRAGRVFLEPAAETLDAVEVTAEREMMELKLDKRVYNVEQDANNLGGSAEDILRNIPSVTVDVDGNVSLRGSANVRILVNGKPSSLTGLDRQAILDLIPANSIQSVEIMTNPSAKYNPEGTAGIINLKLKRDDNLGFNAVFGYTIGTNLSHQGNVNLNYRKKKVNFFSSYNGRYDDRWSRFTRDRTTFTSGGDFIQNQITEGDRLRESHNIRAGMNFFFNRFNTLTVAGGYQWRNRRESSIQSNVFSGEGFSQRATETTRSEGGFTDGIGIDLEIDYQKDFRKEGQSWNTSFSMALNPSDRSEDFEEAFFEETFLFNETFQRTFSDNFRGNYQLRSDFELPLGKEGKLEFGYQGNYRQEDSDFTLEDFFEPQADWLLNDTVSNDFQYDEQVHAIYGTYGGGLKGFTYLLGLRVEQAFTDAFQVTNQETFENDYLNFFPSASISRKLPGNHQLQISFSRRINRPRSRSLNPFRDISDPRNPREGNPNLLPEYINSYEFTYLKFWNIGSFSSSVYYRDLDNIISRLAVPLNDTTVLSTWANIQAGRNYGLEFVASLRPTKWWRLNGNVNLYRSEIDGGAEDNSLTNSGEIISGRLSTAFTFWGKTQLQFSGLFRGRGVSAQGRTQPFYSLDVALTKKVLKDRGTISLRISDIFDTRQFGVEAENPAFLLDLTFKRQSRLGFLGFVYTLSPEKEDRRRGRGRRGGGGFDGGDMDF